jgi:signal transduction histidine kinase
MPIKLKTSPLTSSILLLIMLTVAGYAGNYFSYPFGFGVDFLFGSIAVLIVVNLYGIWWGAIACLIASSHTIILWQHPYALLIFICEALFVAIRLRRGKQNLLTSDMLFWVLVGIPLVLIFYGHVLRVGVITTSIIALKQPVNGIFNALIASLILNCKPIYRWANSTQKATVFFEQILLNLLVAFVLIPALLLMVTNNQFAKQNEQDKLIATLDASAQNLATDLQRWHQSGLAALSFLAETSSQSRIVIDGQTQHSLDLAADSLPIFKNIYIINADFNTIARSSTLNDNERLNFSELELPRIPQIFVLPEPVARTKPKILQTLPIILNDRWLGNIIAELNINFFGQLLTTETHSLALKSTLQDKNGLLIASSDRERQINLSEGEVTDIVSKEPKRIYHWLPSLENKPLIARWRESFYAAELLIDEQIPLILSMKAPAAPFIDYLQILYIRNLAILLAIALASILVAQYISRLLVKPILKMAIFTTDLHHKIFRNEIISIPRSSIIEMNALVNNFEVMSKTVEKNIQQIKQTNRQLKQAKEKSEDANKAKDRFLASISHELKTPLNSIIGYSKLIQKYLTFHKASANFDMEVKSLEWIENVQQDSKYLLTLIDEILDLAKSKEHKTKLYPSLVHFPSFLEDLVVLSRRKAAKKNISFKFENVGKLPSNIYADEPRLRQILLNLLNNAFKFTEQGQVTLQIEINARDQNDSSQSGKIQSNLQAPTSGNLPPQVSIRFQVADTGVGIDRQDWERIFQPFEQIDKFKFQEVGTGLGLSISKELVELMGGDLKVNSEPDRGSVFWFDLMFPEIIISSAIESRPIREIIGHKGTRQTLLVVDDVKTSRMLLLDILEPMGFKVLTAKNGQEGLQLALNYQPSLILTDLFMPIKTGFTLVAELRQIEQFTKTPIIGVSASSFEEVEKQSRASGCDAFLTKPISDRKLLNLLGKYLNIEWIYKTSEA